MSIPVPYRPDPAQLAFDDTISFFISVLLAITVNAEGRAFAATLLGDARRDDKERFHFNPFFHLDAKGFICFLVAGFGWPREVSVDADRFSHPRLFDVLTHLAGPGANFLLANIAGSIVWIMGVYGSEDRVFSIMVSVNAATAIYSLLPIPPLAGYRLIPALLPDREKKFRELLWQVGPLVLIGIFVVERISGAKIISGLMDPLVMALFSFIVGQ